MITPLPAADRVAVPWKNGGGITREIAVFPPGAGLEDFEWRISLAEVAATGPFSLFDGVDRHLTVLKGIMRLDFADRSLELHSADSLAFPGNVAVRGTPLDGPVIDLNVMTRRGVIQASVRHIEGRQVIAGATVLVLNLHSLDAHLLSGERGLSFVPEGPAILIDLDQV